GHGLARRRGNLQHRLQELRLHLPLAIRRHRSEYRLDLLRQVQAVGVEDHQLFLDADRERGAVEAVVEHGGRGYYGPPRRRRSYSGGVHVTLPTFTSMRAASGATW